MNPKSKEVLKGLAREHEKAGEFYEARSRIEDVVKFHGSSAETRAWLCRLYSREHLLNKSAESCLVAVDADPGQADAYLFLATSFRDLEKPDKALITLKRAQARFPKLEPAFTLAGEIHLAEKRVDPAYSAFKRALSIDPNSSKANLGFAEAALLLGQYSEALKTYEHLCTIDKSNNREFRSAYIKLRSQRNQEWEAKFERALEDCQ
jgi:tetratricopeptide (TPR) repeat protein